MDVICFDCLSGERQNLSDMSSSPISQMGLGERPWRSGGLILKGWGLQPLIKCFKVEWGEAVGGPAKCVLLKLKCYVWCTQMHSYANYFLTSLIKRQVTSEGHNKAVFVKQGVLEMCWWELKRMLFNSYCIAFWYLFSQDYSYMLESVSRGIRISSAAPVIFFFLKDYS